MSPAKRDELERLLVDCDDFRTTFHYFFDHFAEKKEFIKDSKKAKLPFLHRTIAAMAQVFFEKEVIVLVNFRCLDYPRLGIYHGNCFVEGRLLTYFFSKRLQKGMASIVQMGDSTVHYSRISATNIDGGKLPPDTMRDDYDFNLN